ncbi:MAG TPA: M48 family metallopeptidase [Patescibacteria group bacterium]|nr:M48 family metallopeptidase [Patescibacteria group bacterium]
MKSEKFLLVRDKKIFYRIRKSKKARQIKVAVYNTGEVVLTVPFFMGVKRGEKFLADKKDWLYNKVPEQKDIVPPARARREYLGHKEAARKLVWRKLEYFNSFYGFPVHRVSIRDQRTRWGSCSSKGNLNFSYKLIKLPEHLCDYVIVHELCHLREMNHSVDFWRLVEKVIPDHTERRKELRNWKFDI